MYTLGKIISNFKDFYNEINTATLTGAIDVIVVEQPDGSYTCSPFHVRFGKLGVLRSREKIVDIEINEKPLDIHMKLGESGEAYFVEEVYCNELGENEYIPPHLACSPIPDEGFLRSYEERTRILQIEDEKKTQTEVKIVRAASVDQPIYWPTELDNNKETSQKSVNKQEPSTPVSKTFCAETLDESPSSCEKVRKISIVTGEFRPISLEESDNVNNVQNSSEGTGAEEVPNHEADDIPKENLPAEGPQKTTSSSNKRKRRKRSIMKKKNNGQKKTTTTGSSSQTEQSEHSESSPQSGKLVSKETELQEAESTNSKSEVATEVTCSHLGGIIINGSDSTLFTSGKCNTCYHMHDNPIIKISHPDGTSVISSPDDLLKAAADNLVELSRVQNASAETDFHFFSDTELTPGCSPTDSRPSSPVQSDTEFEMNRHSASGGNEEVDEHGQIQQSWPWGELPSPPRPVISSSGSRSGLKIESEGPEPISSDEELQKQQQAVAAAEAAAAQRSMLSGMFSFMKKTKRIRHNPEAEGIYLSDLNSDELDPEVAALYFPSSYRQVQTKVANSSDHIVEIRDEEDAESGNGTSLPQSPHSFEGAICGPKSIDSDFEEPKHSIFEKKCYGEISLSLCGGLNEIQGPSEDSFFQNMLTFDDIVQDPKVFENPNLVVRLNGKYYNWRTACPLVMSLVIFQKSLPVHVIETLSSAYMPPKKGQKKDVKQSGYSSWFYWRRPSEPKKVSTSQSLDATSPTEEKQIEIKEEFPESNSEVTDVPTQSEDEINMPVKEKIVETQQASVLITSISLDSDIAPEIDELESPVLSDSQKEVKEGYSGSNSSDDSDGAPAKPQTIKIPKERRSYYGHAEKYRKTLRLSSDQIANLNLKEGANEVVFSVTTAYQGTTKCKCHIYRWRYDDKIVISDIDGTITKSDVLGHILPIVGNDWAQSGVAQLFTKIKNNGYKLLYLSARAIGQARVTREYLKSIKQGNLSLPEGPLLLNPTSLLSAFHREVIEKKPEEFKISCLRDIQALFPENCKPFYAGYGNRVNDVWAYSAVGIPIFRIFTINHKGELKHELTQTFQSSYSNMSYIVDQMFPPPPEDAAEDFSNFAYWRDPIPDIKLDPQLTRKALPTATTAVATTAAH